MSAIRRKGRRRRRRGFPYNLLTITTINKNLSNVIKNQPDESCLQQEVDLFTLARPSQSSRKVNWRATTATAKPRIRLNRSELNSLESSSSGSQTQC